MLKMKKIITFISIFLVAATVIMFNACSSNDEPQKENEQEQEVSTVSFPTPYLKIDANMEEIDEWETKNGGINKEVTNGEGYVQVTYQTSKKPEIARSYVFEEGKLKQAISLWKPYTLVFENKQETTLTEDFIKLIVENGYSNPVNKVREFECYNDKLEVKLIIVPATLNSEVRDLVAQLVFLLGHKNKTDNGNGEDNKTYPDPILPQLITPLCSNPDEILAAEQKAKSTTLMDDRDPIAGYIQQEFQTNEIIDGIKIVRRTYLTNAKNNCLQIAQIVVTPEGSYWKEGDKDYNKKIINIIKSAGYADAGMGKTDGCHYFYKEENMKDDRNYTHIMLQRLYKGRYKEIEEPSISITFSRSETEPVSIF